MVMEEKFERNLVTYMKYDVEKIEFTVRSNKESFIKRIALIYVLFAAAMTICILDFNDYATVSSIIFLLILIVCGKKVFKKYAPKTLFCREITGVNRKEYEYAIQSDTRVKVFSKGNVPHTFANRKAAALRLNGTVYLELDDGSITSISGLYKSHMDIYEEGDTLIRYAGTKFPIVLSREVKNQPCPICGEVNDESMSECRGCGLTIVKRNCMR